MTARLTTGDVIRHLGQESNTPHVNNAYRKGFIASTVILLRMLWVATRRRSRDVWSPGRDSVTVAFTMFRNERAAVTEHIAQTGCGWEHVSVDVSAASGLDFFPIAARTLLLMPQFLFHLVRTYGIRALSRYAHPLIAYATFSHLRTVFRSAAHVTVVTTNMVHPMSLAIHYAARVAGLKTIYLEHAMTPRIIARDRDYDRMLVRSPHTARLLSAIGIAAERIDVLPYWSIAEPRPIEPTCAMRIGFAVNDLDSVETIGELVARLGSLGRHCEIRVHDSDRRFDAFRALAARHGCEISSAAASSVFEFVRRRDAIVVGNSSALLDCLRAGVPVVYFWSGDPMLFDYYGLVEYMNCPSARSVDELVRVLTVPEH